MSYLVIFRYLKKNICPKRKLQEIAILSTLDIFNVTEGEVAWPYMN